MKITLILLAMMGLWISEIDAQVSVSTFTGDADCGISANKVYTHALNVGGPAITINRVPFLGALEEDLESSRGWSDFPPTPRAGNADGLSGSIAVMLSSFQYGAAEYSFTLTGMKPQQAYVVRFWQRAWERGFNRRQGFSFSTDGGESWTEPYVFNPDEVAKGASLNYAYIAGPSGELMMRVVAENPNDTFHLYGVSNEETTPDAVKASPKLAAPKQESINYPDLEKCFLSPSDDAKPGVWWHWMGCNVSAKGITRDLEEFKSAGISSATIFGMADSCTPWAAHIDNSPTDGLIAFTEPWWKLVRHAAAEGKRLGIDVGLHNCPGYTSTGGPWITPELAMQQIFQSATIMEGGTFFDGVLKRPVIDPRGDMLFPMVNKQTGVCEKPLIPARTNYWRDIAVLAVPAEGVIAKEKIMDLTKQVSPEGRLRWTVPPGKWVVYRFGHTAMGALTQPNQWEIMGLECDKMSEKAVRFHLNHVLGELKTQLGPLVGTGLKHVLLDSYEAGTPSWTPLMPEEFAQRRGYDLKVYLPTFANRVVENEGVTQKFKADFSRTIHDLYRDKLFVTMGSMLEKENLRFTCEPYGGPFHTAEVSPYVHRVMTEFWSGDAFGHAPMDGIFNAGQGQRHNILEAEAFTGGPGNSQWTETPNWLKPVGDGAFCAGINRLVLHTNPHQPWDDRYKPGMTMGQWGTHFGRTQTWWEPGKAWIAYLARCQAVLQWGRADGRSSFTAKTAAQGMDIRSQHRTDGKTYAFFIANTGKGRGLVACSFNVGKLEPELWNPVTGEIRPLAEYQSSGSQVRLTLEFAPAQSWIVVFRKMTGSVKSDGAAMLKKNVPEYVTRQELAGPWTVQFDPKWGGPEETEGSSGRASKGKPVVFNTLEDWTQRPEKGIKYYSGTAIYRQSFDGEPADAPLYLDLGTVHHLARIRLNGRDLGVVWCAPWGVTVPKGLLKSKNNLLEIEVTNVWANRMIGDEKETSDCEWKNGYMGGRYLGRFPEWFVKGEKRPSSGRYTFCTWNYFNADSKLVPSGLLGPVRLMREKCTKLDNPIRMISSIDDCNVTWYSPSESSFGSMPLGNGDVGANVWVEQNGDICFYVSKVNAFDAGHLLPKLGRVRVRFEPALSTEGFEQTLLLRQGSVAIKNDNLDLRVWVDANSPLIRVEGSSKKPVKVTASFETLRDCSERDDQAPRLCWGYRNATSAWGDRMRAQCTPEFAAQAKDPILNRTSGCHMRGKGFLRTGKRALGTGPTQTIDLSVRVSSQQSDTLDQWFAEQEKPLTGDWKAHQRWWQAFWERSTVFIGKCGDAPTYDLDPFRYTQFPQGSKAYKGHKRINSELNAFQITQRYALERFCQAAASRGEVPPPYNGSIFTMDMPAGVKVFGGVKDKPVSPDGRDWAQLSFMWQNTRHPYWSMLTRGDYDTLYPGFAFIKRGLPYGESRCKKIFGFDGAFIMEASWWHNIGVFDWESQPGHLRFHQLATVEMPCMMCDYFEHTQDKKFLDEILLPCADKFIAYYGNRFTKRDSFGKMLMDGVGCAETFQGVTNPATEIGALKYLLGKLLTYPISQQQRTKWSALAAALPASLPLRRVRGMDLLAVGEVYEPGRVDCETPEMYTVWPFRQAGLGHPQTLALSRQSFHVRNVSLDGTEDSQPVETGGWQAAPVQAAHLGLAREAARLVSINFNDQFIDWNENTDPTAPFPSRPRPRFPAFWECKMDGTPDNDHGANSLNALQSMLLQSDGRKIYLLPAWPADWDVSFKMCAAYNTTVECVYRKGEIERLKVSPASRKTDIIDYTTADQRIKTFVEVALADHNDLFNLPPMLDAHLAITPHVKEWFAKYGHCFEDAKSTPWPNTLIKGNMAYVFSFNSQPPVVSVISAKEIGRKIICDKAPVRIVEVTYDHPLLPLARAASIAESFTRGKTRSSDGLVDLGGVCTFDHIEFTIENTGRRRGEGVGFILKAQDASGNWRDVHMGKCYGTIYSKRFAPITAKAVQLGISKPLQQLDVFPVGK